MPCWGHPSQSTWCLGQSQPLEIGGFELDDAEVAGAEPGFQCLLACFCLVCGLLDDEDFAIFEGKLEALGASVLAGDVSPASLQCFWESAGGNVLPLHKPGANCYGSALALLWKDGSVRSMQWEGVPLGVLKKPHKPAEHLQELVAAGLQGWATLCLSPAPWLTGVGALLCLAAQEEQLPMATGADSASLLLFLLGVVPLKANYCSSPSPSCLESSSFILCRPSLVLL